MLILGPESEYSLSPCTPSRVDGCLFQVNLVFGSTHSIAYMPSVLIMYSMTANLNGNNFETC